MVEVEPAKWDQHSAAAEAHPVGEVVLEPSLLEGDFGVVGASNRLGGQQTVVGFAYVMLEFQLAEAFKLQLRIKMKSRSNLGISGENKAAEGKGVLLIVERIAL